MKIDNLQELQLCLHIARSGSLTAAAHALDISPQAASAALKRLETRLGTRLFERSTRAVRSTPAGQAWLAYVERALDLMAEGEAQLDAERGALIGRIRLAAPSDLARQVLLPLLDQFLAQHPGVELDLSVSDQPQDVRQDSIDVAVRYGAQADSGLVARPLATAWPTLCASPDYLARHGTPHHPEDLRQHNCLTFHLGGKRHAVWRFAQGGQWLAVRVQGNRSTDDASLARQWAVAGQGITRKSHIDLHADITAGRLVPLLTDWQTEAYPLHAVLPSGRFVPQRVRRLVDFLAQQLQAFERPAP